MTGGNAENVFYTLTITKTNQALMPATAGSQIRYTFSGIVQSPRPSTLPYSAADGVDSASSPTQTLDDAFSPMQTSLQTTTASISSSWLSDDDGEEEKTLADTHAAKTIAARSS